LLRFTAMYLRNLNSKFSADITTPDRQFDIPHTARYLYF
jgi:hypothetical protein